MYWDRCALCRRAHWSAVAWQSTRICCLQVLGKGAFGTVYAGKHKKTGQSYAVKSMEKSKLVTEVRWQPSFPAAI